MSITPQGISFANEAGFGLQNLQLRLFTSHGDAIVTYDSVNDGVGEATVLEKLRVKTEVKAVSDTVITVSHTLENTGISPFWIKDAATGQFAADSAVTAGKSNGLGWDLRFAHTDNLRTEKYPHCLMEYPWYRVLPIQPVVLGEGEDQAFPALYICDDRKKHGVLIAAATQELNYITFALKKAPFVQQTMFEQFEIRHDFALSGGLEIPPGKAVRLDGIYVELIENGDLNSLYDGYLDHLAANHEFRGGKTTLLVEAMHCTWNYGVFADQTEASLMPTAEFIAKNIPGIKYFLMDAGYLHGDIASTFLDRFYPDPNQYVSPESFPEGIRGFTDKLRALGLKPGIWWSPTAHVDSKLYEEHPEWFLRRKDGGVFIIGKKNVFLDYTHPEALDYLDRTLAVILGEWGVDACKMDFWSQSFECREARLHDPTQTVVQVRTRFFETIRKHLPDDGVFMTCVAVGMGNPFIGQHADTYRNTIDIGVGAWAEQHYNCAWALPTLLRAGSKTFLLNNDSVGANLDATENENFFRFTWSFMHQGMLETGGRMEQWPEIYVEAMRRCTANADRGHAVRCVDLQAFTGKPLPQVLIVDYPECSATAKRGVRAHVALFNWDDETQAIGASNEQLGFDGETAVRDFWTDEKKTFGADGIYEVLPGRTARLYEIE